MLKRIIHKSFVIALLVMFVSVVIPTTIFAATNDAVFSQNTDTRVVVLNTPATNTDLSVAVNAKDFGYDTNSKIVTGVVGIRSVSTASVPQAVAMITVFADPSYTSGSFGSAISSGDFSVLTGSHGFITVRNVSSQSITVGKASGIASGGTISLGTWGNRSEHVGLWYNLEAYFLAHGAASGRISVSYLLTAVQLNTLNSFIINNDSWTTSSNCSNFASRAWNSVVDQSYQLSAGTPNTPKNLANSIKSKFSGYSTGYPVPYVYVVYYANKTNSIIKSSVYK